MARADSQEHLKERLDSVVAWSLGRTDERDLARISYVRVDMATEGLGLDERATALLLDVEEIYHLASSVSFSMSEEEAVAANVDTLRRFLDVCEKIRNPGNLRILHYVSTAYVAAGGGRLAQPDAPDTEAGFRNTYEYSKARAEELLRSSGVPFVIHRPSIIVGSSRTGRSFGFETVYHFVRSYAGGLLPFIPADPEHRLDIVPSDYVAETMLALRDAPAGETFHITMGEDAPTAREVFRTLRGAVAAQQGEHSGLDLRFFPPELVTRAETAPQGLASARLTRVFRLMTAYLPFLSDGVPLFDNTATVRATGLRPPDLADYGDRVWTYALEHDFGDLSEPEQQPSNAPEEAGGADSTGALPSAEPETLDEALARAAQRNPDGTALVSHDSELTYAELERRVDERAGSFTRHGIRPGTRLALSPAHEADGIVTLLAGLRAGANVLLLPEGVQPPAEWGPTLSLDPQGLPCGDPDEAAGSPYPGGLSFATSGTTGPPKLVQHTRASLAASGRATARAGRLEHRERIALLLPLFHAFAAGIILPAALHAGASVALPAPGWTGLETLARTRATHAIGVPTHFHSFVEEWQERERTGRTDLDLSRWSVSICGDDPVLPALRDDFEQTFLRPLAQGYGLSEALLLCFTAAVEPDAPDCVGAPLPGVQIRAQDPSGTPLPRGRQGRIQVAAPTAMAGYVGSPPQAQDWIDTGDIGWVDASGRLHVSGRFLRQGKISEVAEVDGHSTTSRQVENTLLRSGKVRRAKVVFVGRTAHAFVVAREGTGGHELEELSGLFTGPVRITQVSDLAQTPVGKVDRTALSELID